MASRVCPEDVVVLASDPTTPGMVCCVGEDTEGLAGGQPTAHVYWLRETDNDKMEPISELRVLDRALLHGDTVVHGKRKGLVTATRIKVDMRYPDGTTVRGVDTDALRHLQPFRQGNWVVSDGWLGRVISCRDDVVVHTLGRRFRCWPAIINSSAPSCAQHPLRGRQLTDCGFVAQDGDSQDDSLRAFSSLKAALAPGANNSRRSRAFRKRTSCIQPGLVSEQISEQVRK